MITSTPRTALLVLSIILGVLEVADGFRLELPWMAWFYAVLSAAGTVAAGVILARRTEALSS